MAVKYSVQFNETVGTTDKQWLIHSNVLGGFTLIKIDIAWSLGAQVGDSWSINAFTAEEVGMWGIEVVDTGTGAYSIGTDFDDFRTIDLHGYGPSHTLGAFPDGTTAGLESQEVVGGQAWRGSRYYPNASDLYVAYSQQNFTNLRIPKGWCSVTLWTG